ncbi:hypothetical protein PGT21_004402 [Puccinia graminis f. sp. tritici]|uniref:Uncharacterized protein n=1 Tax=Puccinia graminis f. sp. tritici TaxID=56615 RepID=A0A5B0NKA3_PUCGR|nr:hypothetical protein PGT21_004402 [Puccinia graminis f. sp. tritici]
MYEWKSPHSLQLFNLILLVFNAFHCIKKAVLDISFDIKCFFFKSSVFCSQSGHVSSIPKNILYLIHLLTLDNAMSKQDSHVLLQTACLLAQVLKWRMPNFFQVHS